VKPDPALYTHLVTRYNRRYWASLYIALARAADTYDPSTGVPFEKYASKRLRWHLGDERWAENTGRSVRALGSNNRQADRMERPLSEVREKYLRTHDLEREEFPGWVYECVSPSQASVLWSISVADNTASASVGLGLHKGTAHQHVYAMRRLVGEVIQRAGEIKAQVADGAPVVSVEPVAKVRKGKAGRKNEKAEKVERVAQRLARCVEFTRPDGVGRAEKVA
jgi:hypothetical protein